jgi:predicted RNase H-like nuclease (RuvC/YqgF family)
MPAINPDDLDHTTRRINDLLTQVENLHDKVARLEAMVERRDVYIEGLERQAEELRQRIDSIEMGG